MTTPAKSEPAVPLEASADGARNAHTVHCEAIQRPNHYALCLHRLNDGRNNDPGCRKNIGTTACPAQAMRELELRAGKALYFKERMKEAGVVTLPTAGKITGLGISKVVVDELPQIPASPKTPDPIVPSTDYMADALNKAFAEHDAAVKETSGLKVDVVGLPMPEPLKKEGVTALVILPGESLLDAARRIIAVRNSQQ